MHQHTLAFFSFDNNTKNTVTVKGKTFNKFLFPLFFPSSLKQQDFLRLKINVSYGMCRYYWKRSTPLIGLKESKVQKNQF